MSKRLAVLGATLTLAMVSFTAMGQTATTRVTNGEQKGSLIFWPRIDLTPGKTTVISLTNDGNSAVDVKCYYMDANKERVDFQLELSKNDTERWEINPDSFPGTTYKGLLVCWAQVVTTEGGQPDYPISWNHLFGKAIIVDYNEGSTEAKAISEYNAWAFKSPKAALSRLDTETTSGTLALDGVNYDTCPKTLMGTFVGQDPSQRSIALDGATISPIRDLLTVATCSQDLRQEYRLLTTKLAFDVFDDVEGKYTNAWECSDSWHETYLGEQNSPKTDPYFPIYFGSGSKQSVQVEANYKNFWLISKKFGPRPYGYYRVWTVVDQTNCRAVSRYGQQVYYAAPGLIGIQITKYNDDATSASDLSYAGSVTTDVIQYVPNIAPYERRAGQ